MKRKHKVVAGLVVGVTLLLTGCADFVDSFSPIHRPKYIKHPDGSTVLDCKGRGLQAGYDAKLFWKENNLRKGTTDFICVDGKAYLPEKVPRQ
ncbi:hypothetical protein AB8Q18_05940 [Neisseriaceae bacterium CLB008]